MLTGEDQFVIAMKKRFDYPLSSRAKRDIGGEGGYGAFPNFPNAAGV